MKKTSYSMCGILAVLIISMTIVTIYLLNVRSPEHQTYFQEMFGDSVEIVAADIQGSSIKAEGTNVKLAVEGILTDGRVGHVVLSVSSMDGSELNLEMFSETIVEVDQPVRIETEELFELSWPPERVETFRVTELYDLSTAKERFFMVSFTAKNPFELLKMKISLLERIAPLSLDIDILSKGAKIRKVDIERSDDCIGFSPYYMEITPLSVTCKGTGGFSGGTLPQYGEISLIFSDGHEEYLYADREDFARLHLTKADLLAGPATVIEENGEVSLYSELNRLIDITKIKGVSVNGIEFPLR